MKANILSFTNLPMGYPGRKIPCVSCRSRAASVRVVVEESSLYGSCIVVARVCGACLRHGPMTIINGYAGLVGEEFKKEMEIR
jgi:hypothetical protein